MAGRIEKLNAEIRNGNPPAWWETQGRAAYNGRETMNRFDKTLEIVNGEIIGDIELQVRGKLYYENRMQSPTFYGESSADVKAQALDYIEHLKIENGEMEFHTLYPKDLELRIWEEL